ncbi:MAG: hypothetical protein EBR64_07970 [Burkholderiaceae bacterium]|nr:hypothetical protein [Burkholderiaceae bacterium]
MTNPFIMKLSVYRYKVWDPQNDNHAQIPPYYAIRTYIEQLEGASVIEDDSLEVEESDLDTHGRIAVKDEGK